MRFLYVNARSVVKKVDELYIFLRTHVCVDIIFICDTWLCKHHNDFLAVLCKFTILTREGDHENDPHGGVMLDVRRSLITILIHDDASHEILFVDITLGY